MSKTNAAHLTFRDLATSEIRFGGRILNTSGDDQIVIVTLLEGDSRYPTGEAYCWFNGFELTVILLLSME